MSGKTIHHTGVIDQTLTGPGGLQVTPSKYRPRVPAPAPRRDGARDARAGNALRVVLDLDVHQHDRPADDLGAELQPRAGIGRHAVLKFPQDVFSNDLDLLGEAGCEQGHIVFQVPTGGQPAKLKFKLDSSRPDPNGGSSFDTHVRLEWAV